VLDLKRELRISDERHTFANFKIISGNEIAHRAFKELAEGTAEFCLLLCYGGVGNGKTHLIESLILRWYERGILQRYTTMLDITEGLKRGFNGGMGMCYDERFTRLCNCDRLVIDDVGMGMSSKAEDWGYSQLEAIIVRRYHSRLITVMATNKELSELPERIVSRCREKGIGKLVLNKAPDYRRGSTTQESKR